VKGSEVPITKRSKKDSIAFKNTGINLEREIKIVRYAFKNLDKTLENEESLELCLTSNPSINFLEQ
jgi:hypothetical protein